MNLSDKYIAITLGDIEIDLSRSKTASVTNLVAAIKAAEGKSLTLDKTFVQSLSTDTDFTDAFPSSLSITIKDVMVAKTGSTKVLSANFGARIGLSELPIVGHAIPKDVNLSIEDFLVLYSTQPLQPTSTVNVNSILPDDVHPIPTSVAKGINFATAVKVGGITLSLNSKSLSTPNPSGQQTGKSKNGQGGQPTPNNASLGHSDAAWVNINKSFGPIKVARIGIGFKDGDLNFLFDASIAFGPLNLGFTGLEIGSPLSSFSPHASLEGLSLDYHTTDFAIGGAFLNQGGGEYSGMFTLSLTKLQLTALGSYKNENGKPSLFLYGLLDEPIGGPAFFFVNGLAVAFGYNRDFIAPPVTGISTFPLVSAASSRTQTSSVNQASLSTMLSKLDKYIPPKNGEYFIGVGIKFMSFKVVNSFVLLIGKFGEELEFDLLGTSTYVAPNPNDPSPISVVELEVVGSLNPGKGTLMFRGQLTPTSFVLSKHCHLEGGFAIAMWMKGEYGGDFVFSFGGYSSHYQPPAHYPKNIPRLGFLWQVDSAVSIKGGGYWALTPKEIMAGGYLKAAYSSSWVRASFDIDAYFLIAWSPLHYEAGFNVSFSLEVKVDLLFVSGWIGFSLSEGLEIHGPPFGGVAKISLWVCDVHIDFGAGPQPKPLLTGSEFTKAFLPKPPENKTLPQFVHINIEKGLIKKEVDVGTGKEVYFINPKELAVSTGSFVPCTNFDINGSTSDGKNFIITPMGQEYNGSTNHSTHTITIVKEGNDSDSTQFSCVPAEEKYAPRSMWEQYTGEWPDLNIITDPDQERLSPLVFGTDITPAEPVPVSCTSSVKHSVLANENFNAPSFKWQELNPFNGQKEKASSINAGSTDPNLFSQLQAVFDFQDSTASDYNGLQNRLTNMGDTEIFVGTLNAAS